MILLLFDDKICKMILILNKILKEEAWWVKKLFECIIINDNDVKKF